MPRVRRTPGAPGPRPADRAPSAPGPRPPTAAVAGARAGPTGAAGRRARPAEAPPSPAPPGSPPRPPGYRPTGPPRPSGVRRTPGPPIRCSRPTSSPASPTAASARPLIGALVGAVVAALVAAALVAVNDGVRRGRPSRSVTTSDGERPRHPAAPRRGPAVGVAIESSATRRRGSGFVLSADGLDLTNAHVIARLDRDHVVFVDGSTAKAELVGSLPRRRRGDDPGARTVDDLVPAELGSSDDLQVGDEVVAIGNALNLGGEPSVTRGIVSAKDRSIETEAGSARAPDPDRRRHQPRQLGRPAGQRARPGRRHQHGQRPRRPEHRVLDRIDAVQAAHRGARAGRGRDQRRPAFLGVSSPSAVDDPARAPVAARHLRGGPGLGRLRHSRSSRARPPTTPASSGAT